LKNEVFNLASKENLSIYDAAYICSAIKNELILITDDKELREKASKYIEYIEAINSGDLLNTK